MSYRLETVRQDFSAAAARYDVHAGLQRLVLRQAAAMLKPYVATNALVLDAGCGTGMLAELQDANWRMVGVDAAEGMCAKSRKRIPMVTCADIGRMPFADKAFDGMVCSLAMQWCASPVATFAELRRVLKDTGVGVCTIFAADTLKELRESMAAADLGGRVSDLQTLAQVQAQVEEAGWKVKNAREIHHILPQASPQELRRHLKQLGAANKRDDRPRNVTSEAMMQRADDYYHEHYHCSQGVRVTWHVITLLMGR